MDGVTSAQSPGQAGNGAPQNGTTHYGPGPTASSVPRSNRSTDTSPESSGSRGFSSTPENPRYPRISRPVELMRESYDVVVIGSGYGGAVAASRMARGRQSVCVLEKGKEKWPGEYPETLGECLNELHISGEFAPGDRRGVKGTPVESGQPTDLLNFVVGEGQNVYQGVGLGGTSLLNANVFLKARPAILNSEAWPDELRGKRDVWEKYYDRASDVLEPTPYPATFPRLAKLDLLRSQAELMGWGNKCYRVPQTTRFEDGPNSAGVYMRASTLTGMDATGINDGSKTTTLVTYVADAWNWGAEVFCECEVRHVEEAPGRDGYIVYFAWHGSTRRAFRERFYQDLMWVHAKKLVFLGAGSLGTTEILLRSRQMGMPMSEDVGVEMSGNGDMLGFSYNTDYESNALGHPSPPPGRPVGPCITGVIDLRDETDDPLDGFVIEDAAIPLALSPIMMSIWEHLPGSVVRAATGFAPFDKTMKLLRRLGSRVLGPFFESGSAQRTAIYLIMSHDSSQGQMKLEDGKPVLRYHGVGKSDSVSRIRKILAQAASAVGGVWIPNPTETLFGQQQISVHPVGGARISKDGTGASGVVNHMGQVFRGNEKDVHEGLVVCDSSIIPAAVGVNPFATITALAERSVELVAEKYGIELDYNTKNQEPLDLYGKPQFPVQTPEDVETVSKVIEAAAVNSSPGFGFTEVMSGYIHVGKDVGNFETAAEIARGRSESATVFLSAKTWNIDEMVLNSNHSAQLVGTFTCAALGGPFIVHRGHLQVFSRDPGPPDTSNFIYEFDMVSPSGRKLHFRGFKVVDPSVSFSPARLWKATTTLFVTVSEPDDASIVARGILNIHPSELAQQVKTLSPTGQHAGWKFHSAVMFGAFFTHRAVSYLLFPLNGLRWPDSKIEYTVNIVKPTHVDEVRASDGVVSTLHTWNPVGKPPTDRTPLVLFIPGASVDHQIFALPTIENNAVDYFTKAGYKAFCVTHRVGRAPAAARGYTPYDARLDIYAALSHIRKLSGTTEDSASKIYIIAHCAGALALSAGLLDGTIPANWVAGITASNVFMNPKFPKSHHLLSRLPIPPNDLYAAAIGPWYDCNTRPDDTLPQTLLNAMLRFFPDGDRNEICSSAVCHRATLVFGRLWSHKNLNEATHSQLERFLGGTSMESLGYLVKAGVLETVITNMPAAIDLVTPDNIQRLKGIPILFFSGSRNSVYVPESTEKSYSILCDVLGRQWYEREVFDNMGHLDCWMGPDSHKTVYPRVERHLYKTVVQEAIVSKKKTRKN